MEQEQEPQPEFNFDSQLEKFLAEFSEVEENNLDDESNHSPHLRQDETKLAEQEENSFENPPLAEAALADVDYRKAETQRLEAETDLEKAKTELERAKTDIMKWIARKAFNFMAWWCSFVALIVWLYVASKQGDIEKEVVIALLGTTTISVVGLVGFIVKGLFGVKDEAKADKR